MKNIGVIQARLGSTRLPNKMLLVLKEKPIIEWVIRRVLKSELLDKVILAIPDNKVNDVLEMYVKNLNLDIEIFRGNENDVVKRFYDAVKKYKPLNVVRICADNPLISPKEIDNLIKFFQNKDIDYAYNHIPKNNLYPDGLGAEIVKFEVLEKIYNNAMLKEEREHIFNYIWNNQNKFKIETFNPENEFLQKPYIKLDIDTFDDYYKLWKLDININSTDVDIIKEYEEKTKKGII